MSQFTFLFSESPLNDVVCAMKEQGINAVKLSELTGIGQRTVYHILSNEENFNRTAWGNVFKIFIALGLDKPREKDIKEAYLERARLKAKRDILRLEIEEKVVTGASVEEIATLYVELEEIGDKLLKLWRGKRMKNKQDTVENRYGIMKEYYIKRFNKVLDRFPHQKVFKDTVDELVKNGVPKGCYQDYSALADVLEILSICEDMLKERV